MPSKRVCPRCFYINDKEGVYHCENCGEDISATDIEKLTSECDKHHFYKDGQYYDECPVELEVVEEPVPEEKAEEPKVRMVKICAVCGTKNPPNSPVCSKCNHMLMGTKAVPDVEEVKEEEEKAPASNEQPEKEERIIHFNIHGYAFKLFNVVLPGIDFSGGEKSYIGRDYQKCLDRMDGDFKYISRKHCYVRMDSRGVVFVGEDGPRGSTWGTAVYKPRMKEYFKVSPEHEVAVEQGDQIILAFNHSPTAFPIVVLKN